MMDMTVLYRPVGQRELDLIAESGFTLFPPRLPEQPIFYPVANEEYARQIARDWNAKDPASGRAGHVLRFRVSSRYLERYPLRTVGAGVHREYWVPAEDLDEFNRRIDGKIELIASYSGEEPRPTSSDSRPSGPP